MTRRTPPEPRLVLDMDVESGTIRYPFQDRDEHKVDRRAYRWGWIVLRRGDVPVGVAELPLVNGVLEGAPAAAATALAGTARPKEDEPVTPVPAVLPAVTVVVCTVARPAALRRAVASLAAQDMPVEIVVVDNSPDGANAEVLRDLTLTFDSLTVAHEPVPGLSRARNLGASLATGEVLAFTDDDVVAEPGWARSLALAVAVAGNDVATGLILPAQLDTPAQIWCQRAGGHGKGFVERTYSLGEPGMPALFPYQLGAYGSGANLAVRRDSFERLGGFDPRLGAGTPSRGGEELDLFLRALRAGMSLRYTPAAVVRHHDVRTSTEFAAQRHAYGVGLAAVLTKHLVGGQALAIAPRVLPGAWYLLWPWSPKNRGKRAGYPLAFTVAEMLGMLRGPAAWHAGVRGEDAARARRQAPGAAGSSPSTAREVAA